jgi:hypothetical protein
MKATKIFTFRGEMEHVIIETFLSPILKHFFLQLRIQTDLYIASLECLI